MCGIHLNAVSTLLNILQVDHSYLPRKALTLLGTLTVHDIERFLVGLLLFSIEVVTCAAAIIHVIN